MIGEVPEHLSLWLPVHKGATTPKGTTTAYNPNLLGSTIRPIRIRSLKNGVLGSDEQ